MFWIAVGLGLVPIAAFVALTLSWFHEDALYHSRLALLRAQGLPTNARELNAFGTVPPGVSDTTALWRDATDAVSAANLSTRGKSLPIVGDGTEPVPRPGQPWAEREASRELLQGLSRELALIRRAVAAGGQAQFPGDASAGAHMLLPDVGGTRGIARVLMLDAHVAAHDGDHARALDDAQGIFTLSKSLQSQPILITLMVRIVMYQMGCETAERLLSDCQWSDAELESLQREVAAPRFRDKTIRALCGERAFCLESVDQETALPFQPACGHALLDHFDAAIDALSAPWPEIEGRQKELEARVETLSQNFYSRIRLKGVLESLPNLHSTGTMAARAEARRLCTIAMQRFRLKNGRWPESLQEIEPRLFGSPANSVSLVDPFDGQPLRFKIRRRATRDLQHRRRRSGQWRRLRSALRPALL